MMTGTSMAGRFATGGPDNRTYKRDSKGRFGSGGGGVRDSLANAGSVDELNAAAMTEARRITGRDIPVDMTGSDLGLAKEQLEGIMQGLDRFPAATLTGVYTYGPGAAKTNMGSEIARLHPDSSAVTQAHGLMENGRFVTKSIVYFNSKYADDPVDYRATREEAHADGYLATRTATGTALHEFGHVIVNQTSSKRAAYDSAVELAAAAGSGPSHFITRHVSGYAASDMGEFAAEAFSDVMAHGSGASDTSRAAFDVIDGAYQRSTSGPANRMPAHGLPLNLTAAEVDLSKVQRDWEKQLNALLGQWFTVTERQRDQILDHIRAAINNNDLAALAALKVSSAEQAQILTESMTQMALQAAQHVTDEAARQGVRIDPVATDTHRFSLTATALAALLASALANAAGREALRRWSPSTTGDDVAAAVRTHLESLSTSFVEDNLGGALHAALNAGRTETMLAAPTAALYASEMMDKRTCTPCERINGKWIGNSDDPNIAAKVEAVYPNGGYRDCEGGVRCRGTTVSIYRPEQVGAVGA